MGSPINELRGEIQPRELQAEFKATKLNETTRGVREKDVSQPCGPLMFTCWGDERPSRGI